MLERLNEEIKRRTLILTEWLQGTAAVRAGAFRRTMLNGLPWQMLRQRLAFGFGWRVRCWSRKGFRGLALLGWLVTRLFGTHAFEFFEGEFKLGDRFVHLFGTTTELHAAEFGNNELEVFDLGLLRTDQCLEQGGVVGQRVGGEHAQSLRDYGCCEQPPKPLFMRIYGVSMCVPDDASRCLREAWKVALLKDAPNLRWPAAR